MTGCDCEESKRGGAAAFPISFVGGLAGCGGEKRKMGVGAAAVLILFAGGLAGCSGEERKIGVGAAADPISHHHLSARWPGVVMKERESRWVRPRFPSHL